MDKRKNLNNTDTHRQCSRCKKVLERSMFSKSKNTHDGLVTSCKNCNKAMNSETYEKRKNIIAERRKTLKSEYVERLGGQCSRCGYSEFIEGLDFHHLGDKKDGIANLITKAASGNKASTKALKLEVKKCVLLCRNCHSAYHANQWN